MSQERVREAFVHRFGAEPAIITRAPGRVNLIGEHTDYNEGFVFPVAIDRYIWVAASLSDRMSLHSLEMSEGDDRWTAYPLGMEWALAERGVQVPPLKAVVDSTLPMGAGVSSSAAIEMAFGVAWNELTGAGITGLDMAVVGQRCENGFIGLKSGIMDQAASACGKAGQAMFFDTFFREITYTPIPSGISVVVAESGKARELAGSKYNERREECERAAAAIGVRALRHASLGELEDAADLMDEAAYKRARHVITEDARCLAFVDALKEGDLARIGELMRKAHFSMRDDFEASSPEQDAMVEACTAAEGCVGARMTGGGFGGACVALVRDSDLAHWTASALQGYADRTGLRGRFHVCQAADGAQRVA